MKSNCYQYARLALRRVATTLAQARAVIAAHNANLLPGFDADSRSDAWREAESQIEAAILSGSFDAVTLRCDEYEFRAFLFCERKKQLATKVVNEELRRYEQAKAAQRSDDTEPAPEITRPVLAKASSKKAPRRDFSLPIGR